ncbi:hypothetical protein [Acinetobacter sp. ANC 4177]|uniref:hypothetical protein n=1 Tax=Acinetobacter sp. ANC 4177 TaxID=2529838 RepID=UPI00103D0E34|nr:hypothetical protein [Acinetobacter sp. ANC 4177]TCB75657.1 hypothetical protein E0H91_04460 [Acinetobacter sp. ANC 4177]
MTFYDYVMQYIKEYDHTLNTEKTIIRYCFYIKKICVESVNDFNSEINRDIDLLINNKDYLLDLELDLHSKFPSFYNSQYSLILKLLSHYAKKEIIRASSFRISNNEFKCIKLYTINKQLTKELIDLLSNFYRNKSPLSQKTHFKTLRKTIIDSNEFGNVYSLENLADNIKNKNQIDYKKTINLNCLYGEKTIVEILGVLHDITRFYNLNPITLLQYKKIQKKITNATELKRFTTFSTALNNYLNIYPSDEVHFKKNGLLALVDNNFEILSKIREYTSTKIFNYFIFIIKILTEKDFDYFNNDSKCLYIANTYGDPYTIRLAHLYKKSEKFAKEFHNLFREYLRKVQYRESSEVTIRNHITNLRRLFIRYFDKEILDKHGINLLFADNHIHFKSLKYKLYEDRLQNKIKLITQQHNYNSLKWFCEVVNKPYLNDFDEYPHHLNQSFSNQRSNTKSYSENELVQILNSLITSIKKNQGDYSNLLVAYFALIQIITGMNISTLCTLKDSKAHIRNDNNNPNIYYLSFIKRRSGSKTETHTYFKNSEDKTIYLFLYIRNVLRNKVIELATNKNFKTDYLFVFLCKNNVLRNATSDNIGRKIRELLEAVGCEVSYDSKRMRKTVSNKIYKIVLKKYSVYRELVHHDFDVFVRHYEEINSVKINDTLSQGTKSLEIYLRKDNIYLAEPAIKKFNSDSEEIEDDNITQFTPLGNCSDNPPDTIPICSDYLACLFCKNFSIVNSESQIHKLLDFKNICIAQILSSSSLHNPESTTIIAIKEFETRVNHLLSLLKTKNPQLYKLAEINYNPNQYFSL